MSMGRNMQQQTKHAATVGFTAKVIPAPLLLLCCEPGWERIPSSNAMMPNLTTARLPALRLAAFSSWRGSPEAPAKDAPSITRHGSKGTRTRILLLAQRKCNLTAQGDNEAPANDSADIRVTRDTNADFLLHTPVGSVGSAFPRLKLVVSSGITHCCCCCCCCCCEG